MSDKLVYDMSNEVNDVPNIFLRKDWINVLDNQNGSYSSNQCIIDTSQISASNKYMSLKEAYLSVPLLLTLTGANLAPNTPASSSDYTVGLKNWYGSIIHSLQIDLQGTTVVQQTNFINMWNIFKLMTTLSWNDVYVQGESIGFYPDDALSWSYNTPSSSNGQGVCNNTNFIQANVVSAAFNSYSSERGNLGFLKRQQYINYNTDGDSGTGLYGGLLTATNSQLLWKSYVSNKVNAAGGVEGAFQVSIRATIKLAHIHSFFESFPLMQGTFFKITLYLNSNATTVFNKVAGPLLDLVSVNVPSGGINPVMVASSLVSNGSASLPVGNNYRVSLSVGDRVLDNTQRSITSVANGTLGSNVFLYVPLYSFNSLYEQAYLSNPIKTIKYTDVYQYTVNDIAAGASFSRLITNGIAGMKSLLILPFFTAMIAGSSVPPYQSPFDPAGCGPTSPLVHLTNFQVQVSGQNILYNNQRYVGEAWNHNLYGCNSINGGLTDGLSSGLLDQLAFETNYCYYHVDLSRSLPIEESVPKSLQILGTNLSSLPINLICFIEYGCEIKMDALTSQRVAM